MAFSSSSSFQIWIEENLAVGTSGSLRHSLEAPVVHPAPKQAAAPRQPPLPHPRVAPLPAQVGCHGETLYTLAFTLLCCALGAGQQSWFVNGYSLFFLFFCLFSSRPKLVVIRVKKHLSGRNFFFFTHCDFFWIIASERWKSWL